MVPTAQKVMGLTLILLASAGTDHDQNVGSDSQMVMVDTFGPVLTLGYNVVVWYNQLNS